MKKIFFAVFLTTVVLNCINAQKTDIPQRLKRSESFFGIHFDLHASEDITDAGKTLTYEMIDTFLKKVRPDFVQIDCKGHPGISSYPTKVGYHVAGFEKDPLRLWREVTENDGVGLYMHFSGVWDSKVVREHPDWAVIKANGEKSTQKVSFFSPYLDTYMIPQLKELGNEYRVDGAWIDGECWAVEPDYGEASIRRFTAETGITEIPRKPSDRYFPDFIEYTRRLFREHLTKYVDAIHTSSPGFQITSNWAYSSMMPEKLTIDLDFLSGDVTPQNGVFRSAFEARCLAPQGKPWDLMAWGFSWDGGNMPMSIKSAIQLKQEAAEIIAMGGGVQFYFQQNRDLSIKPWLSTMLEDIGKFCRERQQYCHKALPVAQIALLYPSEAYQKSSPVSYSRSLPMLQGALYSILDGQNCVEILMEHNLKGRMSNYPLIIIPECDYLEPSFIAELRTYVKQGGNLMIIGTETAKLFREELGIASMSVSPERSLFIASGGKIGSVRSEALNVGLAADVAALSTFYKGSDFNSPENEIAASLNNYGMGKVLGIYFNAGTSYFKYKTFLLRDFVSEMIRKVFNERIAEVTGSKLVHVAVNRLNDKMYVNLINVAGEHTNQTAIGYDEVPALENINVSVKTDKKPSEIILQPEGEKLKFKYENGRAKLSLAELKLHSIIEIR